MIAMFWFRLDRAVPSQSVVDRDRSDTCRPRPPSGIAGTGTTPGLEMELQLLTNTGFIVLPTGRSAAIEGGWWW